MENYTWNVNIRKLYTSMTVAFESAAEAEAFAGILADHYVPDDEKFSVSISTQIVENVVKESEEEPDDEPEEPSDANLEMGFDPYLGAYTNDC